jgi:XTP/dITP diphosphohydrolase
MDIKKLLIASTNKGKIEEIRRILDDSIKILSPNDIPDLSKFDVEENGKTFKENALIKAKAYSERTGFITLADDSGLEVEALNGEPGVHSARYAGLGAGDKAIVEKLLKEMNGLSMEKRRARFVCEICVNDPVSKQNIFASGLCSGYIAFEPKGDNGFGYDPVFIPDASELTMAELEPKIKNSISHRAKALAVLKRKLKIK